MSDDIARRLAGLTPQQREALRRRMSGAGPARATGAAPVAVADGALSVGEEALWAVDQLEPGNPYYNDPVLALRFRGAMDRARLEACVAKLVERHDVLRTRFPLKDGRPVRVLADRPLAAIERRALSEDQLAAFLKSEAVRRFDMADGPLAAFTVVEVGEQDTVLVVSRHHIVSDARSTQILCRELYELYHADGDPAAAAGPSGETSASFATQQRKKRVSGAWDSGLAYWKEALSDVTQVDLPSDLRTQTELSHRGGRLDTPVPAHVPQKVDDFCKANRVTPSVVFLAALHAALAERTGDARFCIGVANDARQGSEFENV
ncbi:MAG TPA: condensation domain-containing protein, partial [Streptomyces sp.]|nr:condensation domain-containing protein [Streptomyces sp.]